jgi:lysozyme family protein
MGYTPMGDIASDQFNSTKYPGVCKPSTITALAAFKRLQTQLNRVAFAKGLSTIAVDGDIGAGTVSLVNKLAPALISDATNKMNLVGAAKVGTSTISGCVSLAGVADVVADVAESYAGTLKAPEKAPAPTPVRPPTLVNAAGAETPAPAGAEILTAFTSASTTMKLAMVAVVGGIGYYLYKGKRRRR